MPTVHITPPPLSSQSMADLLCTIMVLCRGREDNGKFFWAYVCIKPSMAKAFKEARESGNLVLEDFGTIIESGEGMEVPEDIKQRMESQYGANHNYEDNLLAAIEAYKNKYAS